MIELDTGVGRIVWGHPNKASHKRDNNNQVVLKDGKPVEVWSFGLAIPRAQFEQLIWPSMAQETASAYPNVPPAFSWKYKDGDSSIDRKGVPYNQREGYPGHIVLSISTEAFAPPVFKLENGQYRQMQPEEIKTGDYCAAKIQLKVNVPTNSSHTPGLYVNPVAVEFVGYGQEIKNAGAVDPNAAFGGQQRALPPGASSMPVAAQPGFAPPAGPAGMPGATPMPGYPAPQQPQYAPQPGYPAPAPDFIHGQPQYAPPAGPAPQPGYPAPQPQYAPQPQQPQYAQPGPAPMPQYAPPAGPAGMPPMPGAMPPR